jgi:hypothetical protein
MPTKAAINRFGRTARMFFRAALHHTEVERFYLVVPKPRSAVIAGFLHDEHSL